MPIHVAHVDVGVVVVVVVANYPRSLVEAGPRIKAGDELPWVDEDRLKAHYGQQVPTAEAAMLTPITEM